MQDEPINIEQPTIELGVLKDPSKSRKQIAWDHKQCAEDANVFEEEKIKRIAALDRVNELLKKGICENLYFMQALSKDSGFEFRFYTDGTIRVDTENLFICLLSRNEEGVWFTK